MKKQTNRFSFLWNLLFCVGVTCAVLVLLLLIVALITSNGGVSDTLCAVLVYAAIIISWGIGSLMAGLRNRKQGILMGVSHAGSMLLLILIISLLFRGGQINILSLKFLFYLVGGVLVSSLGGIFGVQFAFKKR